MAESERKIDNLNSTANNGDRYPTWKWIVAISILIIGFLATQGINTINAKITDQENTSKALTIANQAVCDRVTKLEANYSFIAAGISKLESQNEKLLNLYTAKATKRSSDGRE